MRRLILLSFTLLLAATLPAQPHHRRAAGTSGFAPGVRTVVLAHNAYPEHGQYEDRLERALDSGTPLVIEEDLAWVDGQSLLIHGKKNVSGGDPTLESYFFPKVQPLMEKALAEGNKKKWPLIALYLDIKNDPPEHLEAISKMLDRYDAWLTTAVKTDDLTKQSPLKLGPMIVLVEDKQNDIKQQYFYDRIPVGGRIRVFGSVTKPAENPNNLSKQEAIDQHVTVSPQQIATAPADNYHRWWGIGWDYIEKGGPPAVGEWTPAAQDRLNSFVQYGHSLGYLVGFYCLDGYTAAENHGWDHDYNFGSRDAAVIRWKAVVQSHADFISTDHYEDVARFIQASREVASVR